VGPIDIKLKTYAARYYRRAIPVAFFLETLNLQPPITNKYETD